MDFVSHEYRVRSTVPPLVCAVPKSSSIRFSCPHCGAAYEVVRAQAGPETVDREITCHRCGERLIGREGKDILKYFLVERPKVQALGQRRL